MFSPRTLAFVSLPLLVAVIAATVLWFLGRLTLQTALLLLLLAAVAFQSLQVRELARRSAAFQSRFQRDQGLPARRPPRSHGDADSLAVEIQRLGARVDALTNAFNAERARMMRSTSGLAVHEVSDLVETTRSQSSAEHGDVVRSKASAAPMSEAISRSAGSAGEESATVEIGRMIARQGELLQQCLDELSEQREALRRLAVNRQAPADLE